MAQDPTPKSVIASPETLYDTPDDLVEDKKLSRDDKKQALETWEQDARQLLTASNEGMPAKREGIDKGDQLGQVQRAKEKIGEKPAKASH